MKFAGIIAEYDPFHNGHAWQLAQARAMGAEHIAVAMSCGLTQRGALPLLPETVRVQAALQSGADFVFALPAPCACAGAEAFARAGVHILAAAGCDALVFGAETPDAAILMDAARVLNSEAYRTELKQQLADTKGIFKGKERKALTEQIQRTEKEIAEKLDKLPDVLKEDGYPDVQAYMATYRKAEAVVEQFNRDLAAWEQQVRKKQNPAKKEQAKPPERESVLKRLRQLQAEGKQRNQPRQRKKSFDRDSR